MPSVIIQAGHQNIKYNIDSGLRSGTGAPGEVNFTVDIANQVSGELRKRGFDVLQTDANANSDIKITNQDYDFFLAIHYDADVYNIGGGFFAYPDPSADLANDKSIAIGQAISDKYFATSGVKEYSQRQNPNTKFYYMWKYLTANTPCGLLECGVGQHHPDDYDLLQNNRQLVVEGIVRGFCQAFNMLYEIPASPIPTPEPPTTPLPTPLPSQSPKNILQAIYYFIKSYLGL